jgi:hypothetical protein
MAIRIRRFFAALACAALLTVPAASFAGTNIDDIGGGGSPPMVDALLMRPLGLMRLGVSCAVFVPAAAITAAVRPSELHVPYEILVLGPARWVFADPLGSH